MLEAGTVWFLIADGRRARLLLETQRGADLQEVWMMQLKEEDRRDPSDRPPRSYDRIGEHRHAMDAAPGPHEQEEQNFLRRVAERLNAAEQNGEFDHLAIAAPAHALGLLRAFLATRVTKRIRATATKDIVSEATPQLRSRLTDMLRGY